jgi:hypothetical protein
VKSVTPSTGNGTIKETGSDTDFKNPGQNPGQTRISRGSAPPRRHTASAPKTRV